jgi:hypothetical protein
VSLELRQYPLGGYQLASRLAWASPLRRDSPFQFWEPRSNLIAIARLHSPALIRAVRFAAEPIAVHWSPHSNGSMSRRGDPLRSKAGGTSHRVEPPDRAVRLSHRRACRLVRIVMHRIVGIKAG